MECTDIVEAPESWIVSAILWPFRYPISALFASMTGIALAVALFYAIVRFDLPVPGLR